MYSADFFVAFELRNWLLQVLQVEVAVLEILGGANIESSNIGTYHSGEAGNAETAGLKGFICTH